MSDTQTKPLVVLPIALCQWVKDHAGEDAEIVQCPHCEEWQDVEFTDVLGAEWGAMFCRFCNCEFMT